ncbi:MAG: HNH endonuclease, partial [Gammaproteobacteria bacterium]|nr:HNH endonuclease [Gammaproteobacteria bacterium]
MEAPAYTHFRSHLESLEAEITELWGHINAAECRFLELVAEFDRREGYVWHGLASTAQWLNWQCGIGAVAARERVRTGRALEALPSIRTAFREGRLSYSKVRALTRVATAENESLLLEIALDGTAQHVEKLVRQYARVRRWEDAARVQAQHRERYLDFYYDEDGSLIIKARLPSEVGALVRQSIQAAMDVVERSASEAEDPDEIQTHSNVSAETSAPDDAALRVSETVRERTDDPISARRADALVHVLEHFVGCDAVECDPAADRYQVVVHIDQSLLSERHDQQSADTLTATCCEIENGPQLAVDTARRLGCDGTLVGLVQSAAGEPLDIGRTSRAIPPALKRALNARDRGCRFPGCTHKHFTEGHHVKHWADGGETKLSNLITLCTFHHRLVHEGGFGLTATDDGL